MNAATHTPDLAQLTEHCTRRLFERLEAILDACTNLDNPRHVNATLRAVSLLLRLCTTTRARPPREAHAAPVRAEPFEDPATPTTDAAAHPNTQSFNDPAATTGLPATPTSEPARRTATPLPPHAPVTTAALSLPTLHHLIPPTPAAALAARAGLALGPSP